jgi:hypothetical protein
MIFGLARIIVETYPLHRLSWLSMIKSSNTIKYGFRPPEAAYALGSEKLLAECVAAGWIKPTVKRHKLTLYDRADIATCWSRILAGEMPSEDHEATRR